MMNAIGIRAVYLDLVLAGSLRTIFRPEDPKYEQLYPAGAEVELRIIAVPGLERGGVNPVSVPPIYMPGVFKVVIEDIEILPISQLAKEDFLHSSPDVQNTDDLAYHLGMIYNKPASEYGPNTVVTKITFRYLTETNP